MKLTDISNILQVIVDDIPGVLFLRATDNDANISIDNIDLLDKTIVLFNNLPVVDHNVSQSGAVGETWPIEVRVLKLASVDDKTTSSDSIRDDCQAVANTIFDKVTASQDLPDAFNYVINFQNNVKVYDKVMTGCLLTFELYAYRSTYEC